VLNGAGKDDNKEGLRKGQKVDYIRGDIKNSRVIPNSRDVDKKQ